MIIKVTRKVLIIIVCLTKGTLLLILYLKFDKLSDHLPNSENVQAENVTSNIQCPTVDEHPPHNHSYLRYCLQTKTHKLYAEIPFRFSTSTLTSHYFPINRANSSSPSLPYWSASQFVFVTAANCKFFHSAMDAVGRVQKLFPNHTVYFYDLGDLSHEDANHISRLNNVIYRQFNFSQYPDHVSQLTTYAFKPLLVHEMLREHSSLFWIDSSIRLSAGPQQLDAAVQTLTSASRRVNLMLFDSTGSSNFAATHSDMFRYLPISKKAAIGTTMHGANAIFINYTQQLYDHVLRWWFLCALEPNCIAPTHDLYCHFRGRDLYAECHRYDQSALNILLANYFDYEDGSYLSKLPVLTVQRRSQHKEKLLVHLFSGNISVVTSREYFGYKLCWLHQLLWLSVASVVIGIIAYVNIALIVVYMRQREQVSVMP